LAPRIASKHEEKKKGKRGKKRKQNSQVEEAGVDVSVEVSTGLLRVLPAERESNEQNALVCFDFPRSLPSHGKKRERDVRVVSSAVVTAVVGVSVAVASSVAVRFLYNLVLIEVEVSWVTSTVVSVVAVTRCRL